MTRIFPEEFLLEVKRFNLDLNSQNKVRRMIKGNTVFLKFHNPMSGEVIETIISLEDFKRTEFMNWGPISVPATWVSEEEELIKINNKLEELNATTVTQPSTGNNSQKFRQFSA